MSPARSLIGASPSRQQNGTADPPTRQTNNALPNTKKRKRVSTRPNSAQKNAEKRILQPRLIPKNSILAQAFQAENNIDNTVISPYHRIAIVSDSKVMEKCRNVPVTVPRLLPEIQVPQFRKLPSTELVGKSRRPSLNEEDLSEAAYERRHRKHELLEKRSKNREKEKLAHERLKLAEEIEQLQTMDYYHLLPIAALRGRTEANNVEAAEHLRQRLLKEAQETMQRYIALGGGDKKKDKKVDEIEEADEELEAPKRVYQKRKVETHEEALVKRGPGRPRKNPLSVVTTPAVFTTFINAAEKYKGPLPFGQRMPYIPNEEFTLPEEEYGAALKERKAKRRKS